MKLTTWVDFSKEIEVQITGEEAVTAILEEAEDGQSGYLLERGISNFASFMRKVPDSLIEEIKESPRKQVAEFFREQADRFDKGEK